MQPHKHASALDSSIVSGARPGGASTLALEETAELPAPAELRDSVPCPALSPYLMVIRGPAIGTVVKLTDEETTIGRGDETDVLILDAAVSRRHAMLRALDGNLWRVEDLGSRNGTWVNGERVDRRLLEAGDRIQLGSHTVLKFTLQDPLEERFQQRLYEASIRDGLTGAYNQRFFMEHLQTEFAWAVRHEAPLSLVIFDVDEFKAINDNYGHLLGDRALCELTSLVSKQLRAEDALARYGGDEFCVTLRSTGLDEARLVAERIRRLIASHDFGADERPFRVSVSVGVASLSNSDYPLPEDLIEAADLALYEDKSGPRRD